MEEKQILTKYKKAMGVIVENLEDIIEELNDLKSQLTDESKMCNDRLKELESQ